jgi:serine/threonine protein kinase
VVRHVTDGCPFAALRRLRPGGLLFYVVLGWELWGIMSVSQMLVAGRYRLLQSLGSGGMGRVWLARDEVLRREVAVKEVVLPADLSAEDREELCLRTLREARAAGRLSHPNVVQIYDVVETQGRPWIVMELIRSRSLYQVMKQDGPLPPRRVAEIGLFLLAALRAAHRAGVLHRDVKPGNVLLADDGRVVLTDFGLATFDGGDGSVTRSGLILGSAQYIAPERARDGASGPETDLWSLGATLYAAVEGRSPYARETSMATLTALATEPPDPPQRSGPLKSVLLGLLRRNPRARMGFKEAERLLRRVASGEGRGLSRLTPRQRDTEHEDPADRPVLPAADGEPSAGAGSGGNGHRVTPESVGSSSSPMGLLDRDSSHPRTRTEETMRAAVRRRTRRWPWVLALLIVAVASIPGVALLVDTQRDRGTGAQPSASPQPGGSSEPGASSEPALRLTANMGPQACAAEQPGVGTPLRNLPTVDGGERALDGRGFYTDPSGFRIGMMPGWSRFEIDSLVCFRDAQGTRVLAVDQRNANITDPVAEAGRGEADWVAESGMDRYKKIDLKGKPIYAGGAELEYTYVDPTGEPMHGMNLYIATADRFYMIYWVTSDSEWPVQLDNYRNLTIGFRPAP